MSQVAKVQAIFDTWAQNGRADGMERGHGPTAIQAFKKLELRPGQNYLDIGCGNGYTVRWAANKDRAEDVWGIDVAPEMIALARRMSADSAPRANFFAGEFPSETLPENHFDAVFSMEVFYYFPSVDDGLSAVQGLLKPGGLFTCVVDYYQENAASHSWPEDTGVAMTLWSADQWREGFARAGLEVVEQSRLFPTDNAQSSPDWKQSEGSLMTLGRKSS
ncbi:MAG: class I SAM-dependent methyltransferase [Myxococcales bacterium]|nr:class I SAM-dependent methyltransferase [Myxococcales bacterium]